jgi:hypothetical protein
MNAHLKKLIEEFDVRAASIRAHFLHAIGVDEHQLAHDTETAAKPLVAEVKQDAVNLAEEAVSGAPAKPAETTGTNPAA